MNARRLQLQPRLTTPLHHLLFMKALTSPFSEIEADLLERQLAYITTVHGAGDVKGRATEAGY